MALKTCPDCGGPLSSRASSCPKCGRMRSKAPAAALWIILLIVICLVVWMVVARREVDQRRERIEQLTR